MANAGIAALSGVGGLMRGFNTGMQRRTQRGERQQYQDRMDEMLKMQQAAAARQVEQQKFKQEKNLADTMRNMRGRISSAETLTGTGLMGDKVTAQQLSGMPVPQQVSLAKTLSTPKKLPFAEQERIKTENNIKTQAALAKLKKTLGTGKYTAPQEKAISNYFRLIVKAQSIRSGEGIAPELDPGKSPAIEKLTAMAEQVKQYGINTLGIDPGAFAEAPGAVSAKNVSQKDPSKMTDAELSEFLGWK